MFPANAFGLELFASWCFLGAGRKTSSHWKTIPLLFPLAVASGFFFFAAASWLHIPSLGVSAALSLDIASSCFLAVCPFATADPLSSCTSCLLIPLQCGAC